MTDMQLFSAIGQIDEKYIEEAAPKHKAHPRLVWVRYAAAACLFIAILGGIAFVRKNSYKPSPSLPSASLNQSSEENSSLTPSQGAENSNISAEPDKNDKTEPNRGDGDKADAVTSDKPNDTKGDRGNTKGGNYNYVNIMLSNNGRYRYVTKDKLKELGIAAITQNDLGEKIGEISRDNCSDDRLIGCEFYRHKPTNCDAFIIVKKGEKLLPFQFSNFIEPYLHDFKELFSFYNVASYKDITHISTEIIKKEGTKAITNPQDIKEVYNILISPKNNKELSDNRLKEAREKYINSPKTVLLATLHFKNGLSYRFAYEPYLVDGYIKLKGYLTKEQNDTLLSILL